MTPFEKSQKANELRKAGDIPAAKELYAELWKESKDKFTAAGLLHCYRKLDEFDNALPLVNEIASKYSNFNWVNMECTWTLIQGKLNKVDEDVDTLTVLSIAEKILALKPDFIALKATVFKVIKIAKKNRDWEIVLEWLDKIDPDKLENENDLKKDWSDKEIWWYYKIVSLIKIGSFKEAISFIEEAAPMFPSKAKFFEREKAMAQIALEDFSEGEKTYSQLAMTRNADWWLLREYAVILLKNQKTKEAIQLFCKAALSPSPLHHKVTLFKNIAEFALSEELFDVALAHFMLIHKLRLEQGWGISTALTSIIDDLSTKIPNNYADASIKDLLQRCKQYWRAHVDDSEVSGTVNRTKGLRGKVKLGDQSKPFCFIETKENSYFCSKADLPAEASDGQFVVFDLKESFDKKKGKKSWKAVRIRIVHNATRNGSI